MINDRDYLLDIKKYGKPKYMPLYQKYYRFARSSNGIFRLIYILLLKITRRLYLTEISHHTNIGPGLYINHPYLITINHESKIGSNVILHKGVTIGKENRGKRVGTPTIGNKVWIGVNSTIVGNITIGNDVLIAPNTFVNCDIPDHSIVFGNPCIIKHRDHATEYYL